MFGAAVVAVAVVVGTAHAIGHVMRAAVAPAGSGHQRLIALEKVFAR